MLAATGHIKAGKPNGVMTALYAAAVSFLAYASVYAYRKPFTVGSFATEPHFLGLAFKDALVISQLLGYMLSKFFGIRFISEMKNIGRTRLILLMVMISWMSLLLFAIVPAPYNILFLFTNGFPLGIIWGIVFSFVEGRRLTDFIGAALSVSFIFSSGFVKSVAQWLMLHFDVAEKWMPFVTGLVFVLPLIFFLYLLERTPQPDEEDRASRVSRKSLNGNERKQFFKQLQTGLVLLIIVYVFLTIFRDIRDNFAADIWRELGYGNQPSVFTVSEIPVTIFVLLLIGSMIVVRNNKRAFFITHIIIASGFLLAGIASFLFISGLLDPFVWMILVGLGLYAGYIPFNCIVFERLIAAFRKPGNVGFLMYTADSFGYLGSTGVLLSKTVFHIELNWVQFYSRGVVVLSIAGLVLTFLSVIYFRKKLKKVDNA